jgi:hypothetical protein
LLRYNTTPPRGGVFDWGFKMAGKEWGKVYLDMVEECGEADDKLSDWGRGFLDSLAVQLSEGREPSARQVEKLEQIHGKCLR